MTKKEYKTICKLIDLRTTVKNHDNGYYGSYNEKLIVKSDIAKLKSDIKEIFFEDEVEE